MKFAVLCLAAVLLAGCSKNIDTPEAVREGVLKDISKKMDVNTMDVNIDSVSFREKEATAQVSFRPKGAATSQAITMNYQLERQGDEWRIKNRSMQGHGDQAPASSGGAASPGAAGGALPPGHPGISPGAQGGQLPSGHPTVPGQGTDTSKKQ